MDAYSASPVLVRCNQLPVLGENRIRVAIFPVSNHLKNDANDGKNTSDDNHPLHSNSSHHSHKAERLLPPRGDYQTLLSFQKAEVVYNLT